MRRTQEELDQLRSQVEGVKVRLLHKDDFPLATMYAVWHQSKTEDPMIPPVTVQALQQLSRLHDDAAPREAYIDKSDFDKGIPFHEHYDRICGQLMKEDFPLKEMPNFIFVLENMSVSLREQLVRKRQLTVWSQSSRITDLSTFFDRRLFYIPPTIEQNPEALDLLFHHMEKTQQTYRNFLDMGIPNEDARVVMPEGRTHRLAFRANIRELQSLFKIRTCLTGDTRIPLLDGSEVPIRDLVGRSYFWLYSCTPEGEIVPGVGRSARRVGQKHVWEVTLDNDETITATEDHPFMMRDGSFRGVRDLRVGDSLMPLYRRPGEGFWQNYEQLFNPATASWELTHQRMHDLIFGPPPAEHVRHHMDFDSRNNSPENLFAVPARKHREIHRYSGAAGRFKEDPGAAAEAGRRSSPISRKDEEGLAEWSARYSALMKKTAARLWTDPEFAEYRERMRVVASENQSRTWSLLWRARPEEMREFSGRARRGKTFGPLPEEQRQRISTTTRENEEDMRRRSEHATELNHRREPCEFCGVEMSPGNLARHKEARHAQVNHRIVSIKYVGVQDVYDITVDEWENFAVSAGVFVHNCYILQASLWKPVVDQVVQILRDTDPLLLKIFAPPCIKSGRFTACAFDADNLRRESGDDPLPPCTLWLVKTGRESAELVDRSARYLKPYAEMWGEDFVRKEMGEEFLPENLPG